MEAPSHYFGSQQKQRYMVVGYLLDSGLKTQLLTTLRPEFKNSAVKASSAERGLPAAVTRTVWPTVFEGLCRLESLSQSTSRI
jgi:hypothetical protein